jgi:hypothetical protein
MIIYKYKKFFIKIEHVYFSPNIILSNADVVIYYQCQKKYFKSSLFPSPVIYLKNDFELIESYFRSSIRQEITQVKKKYQIICSHYFNPENNILHGFMKFYNSFANRKNLPYCDKKKITKLRENILITCASKFEKIFVYHVYLFDKTKIRLWYSALKTDVTKSESQLIGKANKFLHYQDIKLSKKLGFLIYDFGGAGFSSKNLEGIRKFKLGFTKDIETTYNFVVANTFLGKIALLTKKFLQ